MQIFIVFISFSFRDDRAQQARERRGGTDGRARPTSNPGILSWHELAPLGQRQEQLIQQPVHLVWIVT
jgi:hypothetical protein